MLSINTNLSSLTVQQNFTKSTNALNTAIERLTTGFKINHASDNAANYSIANNYDSKLSSYEVASDNVSMGLDMVQTAMDSMDLISNHLSRIRDLAEQASNGTYGQDSLNAINAEVQARVEEINRIISNTEFNDIQLLQGEQVESNVTGYFLKPVNQLSEEEAIAQGYTVIKTKSDLENIKNNMSGKYILMNDIDLQNTGLSYSSSNSIGTPFCGELNGNGYVIKNFTPTANGYLGLFTNGENAIIKNLGLKDFNIGGGGINGGIFARAVDCNINNCYIIGSLPSYPCQKGGFLASGNNNTIQNSYSDVSSDEMYGSAVCSSGTCSSCSNVYWNKNKTMNPAGSSSTLEGATGVTAEELAALVLDPSEQTREQAVNLRLQVGINGDTSSQIDLSLGGLGLSGLSLNITTNEDGRNALAIIDSYLNTISSKQTEYGAVYNRLQSAFESIEVSMENLTSSLSTIRDADVAVESSNYIKAQILQQASATLLSTANQTPALTLQLLQGLR